MEVSGSVSDGVALCGDEGFFNNAAFSILVQSVFSVLRRQSLAYPSIAGSKLTSMDQGILKQAHGSLVAFLLEAAKNNTSAAEITVMLEEMKVFGERATLIAKSYSENLTEIRSVLGSTGFNFPHIVDVDWRLDYYIKNNHLEKVNKPVYLVTLKTEVAGKRGEDVQFNATPEELQDLVNKLKDATKKLTPEDGKGK